MSAAARPTVILASASTGRLGVLRAAGVEPVVVVSDVDEDAIRARLGGSGPAEIIEAIAGAKADAVVRDHRHEPAFANAVVIAGDSMLFIDGELQGKPHTREETRRRWYSQMGRAGDLITGHAVLRLQAGEVTAQATGSTSARVAMSTPSDRELDAYLDSGEPLEVAGAFTIDGLGGWFIDSIVGDPSGVVGLSLPLVRRLLAEVGITVTDLWNKETRL